MLDFGCGDPPIQLGEEPASMLARQIFSHTPWGTSQLKPASTIAMVRTHDRRIP